MSSSQEGSTRLAADGPPDTAEIDSPAVASILEQYLSALEVGAPLDREELLAAHPELADQLSMRLDALDFIHNIAPQYVGEQKGEQRPLEQPPKCLGDFRLLREVGRGGMGVVYEAEQISLGRRVALKVLPFAALLDARRLRRFQNEAHAAATLDHPHIVSVYAVGTDRGVHYFAMQYIEGRSLAKVIEELRVEQGLLATQSTARDSIGSDRGTRPDRVTPNSSLLGKEGEEYFRTVARVGIQAAEALDYAHTSGILHRDIKPANLMLDEGGNVFITDFGLARIEGEPGMTASGDLLGTIRYMSPEQASADRRAVVDHRADVYSLGITLHELLTLEPAFPGDDRRQLLQQIILHDPPAPRTINRAVPVDLETIILKATAKQRSERYASAQDLADDLSRYVNELPIWATRPTLMQRAAKWCRRQRTFVVTGTVSLILALLVSTLAISVAYRQQAEQQRQTHRALERAEQSETQTQQLLYASDIRLASLAQKDGDLSQCVELLDGHFPTNGNRDLRGFEWFFLRALIDSDHVTLEALGSELYFVCLSPDSRLLAAAGEDAQIHIYELNTYRELFALPTEQGEINGLAFAPDSRRIVSAGDNGTLKTWDLETKQLVQEVQAHGEGAYGVVLADSLLVSCGAEPVIRLWDQTTGDAVGTLEGHKRNVEAIALSPDGRTLASASSDETARLWDLSSRRVRHILTDHDNRLTSIAFSPGGRWLATGSVDKTVTIWDAQRGSFATRVEHLDGVQCVAFAPDGELLATGDRGGSIRLWRGADGAWPMASAAWSLERYGGVRWCALSPDGQTLAAVTPEGIVLRDWQSHEVQLLRLDGDTKQSAIAGMDRNRRTPLEVFRFSRSSAKLAFLNRVYVADPSDPRDWQLLSHLDVDSKDIACLAFSPDERILATGLKDGSIVLWDLPAGTTRARWKGHPDDWVLDLEFTVDGSLLCSLGEDARLVFWDATTGAQQADILDAQGAHARCLAITPDGRQLAFGGRKGVWLWDLETGSHSAHLPVPSGHCYSVVFSADGALLAAECNRRIHVWDVAKRELLRVYPADPTNILLTPDTAQVIANSGDDLIRFWDLGAGKPSPIEPEETLQAHEDRVYSMAFLPNSPHLASVGQDGNVTLWSRSPSLVDAVLNAPSSANDVAFLEDGHVLAVAGGSGVYLMDVSGRKVLHTLDAEQYPWKSVAASRRTDLLAATNGDGKICLWDLRERRIRRTWRIDDYVDVGQIAFSPDDRTLAVASHGDEAVLLFDVETGDSIHPFPAGSCEAVAFSPDGKLLACATGNEVCVWDLSSRAKRFELRGHTSTIKSVKFSPDGRLLASGGRDRRLILWDAVAGQRRYSCTGHRHDIRTLAFSPDGRSLVTGDEGGACKIWQVASGRELFEVMSSSLALSKVLFSADGRQLLCVLYDGTIRLIRVNIGPETKALNASN